MTKRPRRVPPLTRAELDRLSGIRLDEGWSFREMGDQIGLTESTTINLIRERVRPIETTTHKVRKWLETYQPTPKAVGL